MSSNVYVDKGAIISPDQNYRYLLWREWRTPGQRGTALFVMLNPSTADADLDDATIRRCVAFTKSWGFCRLEVVNLFGFRARDPKDLKRARDPNGPDNFRTILERAAKADKIICAWGAHGTYMGQDQKVIERLLFDYTTYALHFTNSGVPGHPLYLPSDSTLKEYA